MKGRLAIIAPAVVLVLLACAGGPASPGDSTASSATPTPAAGPEERLREAVGKLEALESFRLKVEATHHWSFEGKEYDWEYQGEGAWVRPDRFYSSIQGPADTLYWVRIIGQNVTARDARGVVTNPTKAFGGPGYGAAPYSVIAYLKNFDKVASLGVAAIDGVDTYHLGFETRKNGIAALDSGLAQQMERVTSIQGEVWIDRGSGSLRRERVRVDYLSGQGVPEWVNITLHFLGFNQAVEIP